MLLYIHEIFFIKNVNNINFLTFLSKVNKSNRLVFTKSIWSNVCHFIYSICNKALILVFGKYIFNC